MKARYDRAYCDLCGSGEFTVLAELSTGRALRSDRVVIDGNLCKLCCSSCGLVREGNALPETAVLDYYANEYRSSEQLSEHLFYTTQGPVTRSAMIADWVISAMG